MKALLALLLLFAPFTRMAEAPIISVQASASDTRPYRWYVCRNEEHLRPRLPSEFSFLREVDAWYCDERESAEKTVYLTFDAGYENGNIARILNTLKEKEVPAAFFILENLVRREAPLVRRMTDEGHLVCNHTARHKNLCGASDEAFRQELERMETVYRDELGCEMSKYYRPPEGTFSLANLKAASAMGYKTVFWSFAYADWANDKQPEPKAALQKILAHIHPGAVLLLHPTSATNADILGELIDTLVSEGYRFGTLDELTAC